ncbi:MAG: HPr family phosphocarrier protein [Bacillota bacterium]|nr:HPr family phosphocarrier protein [Bacillota bacterium]
MKTVNVHLSYINDVKKIVSAASDMECEIDLVSGRYTIDARSIMGIFSLDFSKPITLEIHGSDDQAKEFTEKIKEYLVN